MNPTPSPRYLLLRPGAIGDAIVTLPTVQRLRESQPGARVELVVGSAAAALLAGRCEADAVYNYEEARWAALFQPALPAEAEAFWRSYHALLLYLTRPPQAQEALMAFLGNRVILWPPLPEAPLSIARHLQGALGPLGIAPRDQFPRLTLQEAELAFARAYWAAHPDPRPVVAFHPGSGSARKNWPVAQYAELGQKLAQAGARLLVIAGPADEEPLRALLRGWKGEPPLVTLGLTLPQVGALLTIWSCLVGNDSGIAHLAAALGVPTVVLFGPSDPRVWAPLGPAVTVLAAPLGDLSRLPVAEVAAAAQKYLTAASSGRS